MEKTTRIADLPENITMQMPNYNQNINHQSVVSNAKFDPNVSTNYVPINVHPNPYGMTEQNPIMPMPQQPDALQMKQNNYEQMSMQKPQYLTEQHQMELQNMQQIKLPSRDIPIDTTSYLNDEQVQPNYIPRQKLTGDYIRDYEETTDKNIREHEQKKYRESRIDQLFNEFQTPIFIIILFFMFQLPIVNTLIFKKFSFLSLHNIDGNFNFYGLLFKSILFGLFFYSSQKVATFISEF
jgi:hypothetical protein